MKEATAAQGQHGQKTAADIEQAVQGIGAVYGLYLVVEKDGPQHETEQEAQGQDEHDLGTAEPVGRQHGNEPYGTALISRHGVELVD